MRIAAIEVSHWHSLYDAAYLRILADIPGVTLVGLHDPSAGVAGRRAAAPGNPPIFTDYREMLTKTQPDFVVALGQHSRMAETAHDLLDYGVAFMMEKPMGVNAAEVERIAEKAAAKSAFVAVPLPQRYSPFVARARLLLTGEEAQVTAAQLSARALGQRVEDYATVLLRSASGVLGTIELGNTVPYAGSDGELKIAGRDATLVHYHDDTMRLITAGGEETISAPPAAALYPTAVRDILDHWRRGVPPPIGVRDCLRVVRLIDQAYELAGRMRA